MKFASHTPISLSRRWISLRTLQSADIVMFMQALYPEQMGLTMPVPSAPPAPAEVVRPAMMLSPVPAQMRVSSFPQEVLDCCDDGETCRMAFCCPCCAHGVLCHDIEESGYCMHCILWLLFSLSCNNFMLSHHFLCFPAGGLVSILFSTMARIRLRDKYGLAGDKTTGMLEKRRAYNFTLLYSQSQS